MNITYANKQLKAICTNAEKARRKYGQAMADKIHQRIDEIKASDSIEIMLKFKVGRCHCLKENRKNQYAVDLVHPYRLVFTKLGDAIQVAHILEIVDYH